MSFFNYLRLYTTDILIVKAFEKWAINFGEDPTLMHDGKGITVLLDNREYLSRFDFTGLEIELEQSSNSPFELIWEVELIDGEGAFHPKSTLVRVIREEMGGEPKETKVSLVEGLLTYRKEGLVETLRDLLERQHIDYEFLLFLIAMPWHEHNVADLIHSLDLPSYLSRNSHLSGPSARLLSEWGSLKELLPDEALRRAHESVQPVLFHFVHHPIAIELYLAEVRKHTCCKHVFSQILGRNKMDLDKAMLTLKELRWMFGPLPVQVGLPGSPKFHILVSEIMESTGDNRFDVIIEELKKVIFSSLNCIE